MATKKQARPETWKKGRGISLTPAQWSEVDTIAENRGDERGPVAVSEVVSDAVDLYLSAHSRSVNSVQKSVATDSAEAQSEQEMPPLS